MKLLLTGSSGCLGEGIARTLIKKGIEYVGIDINKSEFTTHTGSITDRKFVKELMGGIDFVIHAATLHKPHVATHSKQDFIDTNITGTLNLLEEAKLNGVKGFVYTSTTSAFGDMLRPKDKEPATWITEETRSIPKNIYGVTKLAAEDLCQLFFRNHKLPCLILKTSRFFQEEDDRKQVRASFEDLNIKANEFLYRRVDLEDAVLAHLLAIDKMVEIGFARYIISATSPFTKDDLKELNANAASIVSQKYPDFDQIYKNKEWKMLPTIDRVYVNEKARIELGWNPKYDFQHVLNCLKEDKEFRSPLSLTVHQKIP